MMITAALPRISKPSRWVKEEEDLLIELGGNGLD
jgi:hypothetical protein